MTRLRAVARDPLPIGPLAQYLEREDTLVFYIMLERNPAQAVVGNIPFSAPGPLMYFEAARDPFYAPWQSDPLGIIAAVERGSEHYNTVCHYSMIVWSDSFWLRFLLATWHQVAEDVEGEAREPAEDDRMWQGPRGRAD